MGQKNKHRKLRMTGKPGRCQNAHKQYRQHRPHNHRDQVSVQSLHTRCSIALPAGVRYRPICIHAVKNVFYGTNADGSVANRHRLLYGLQTGTACLQANPDSDSFVLTCGNDCNILLHMLSNGQRVGQFGQSSWNIKDMTTMKVSRSITSASGSKKE